MQMNMLNNSLQKHDTFETQGAQPMGYANNTVPTHGEGRDRLFTDQYGVQLQSPLLSQESIR